MEDYAFLQIGKKLWKKSEGQVLSARGASGGLGTIWNANKFIKIREAKNTQWLFTKLQHLESDMILSLFNVYAPVSIGEKKHCWDSIRSLANYEELVDIIIAGDLNLTLSLSEKHGGSTVRDLAREWVEDLLQDWDMIEIKPSSGKYTWTNKRVGLGHIAARLDKFLVQSYFLLHGLESRMHILPCCVSDHLPIKLELLAHLDQGSIPFKFNSHWITKEILDKEANLQHTLLKASLAEEEYWRLKSRCLWLKAGGRNSSFFHKQAQARKCLNSISEIKVETITYREIRSIKNAAFTHFKNLYSEEEASRHVSTLVNEVPALITDSKNQFLEAEISNNEIKSTLFVMEPDKAPGPDGFTARFLQSCWLIVEKDLSRMIQKSQECQKIGGSTNSAFLALIPKEKGANTFNRFRPISLCNIGYKLITKVIANRLKIILPDIIPTNQGGFIQGRQIVDNFILVQEAIHSSLDRKERGMVVKLDLENDFDRVRHSFLMDFLRKFGFGPKFINWIKACINEPWIAPLVNGRAMDFFKASHGLRQGCPLSPLLFVLQASVLSFLLNKKQQDQELMGLNIARGVNNINHALFADDSLLLGAATVSSAKRFKDVVDDYCEGSGSSLNKGKCHIYCWNTPASALQAISSCFSFASSSSWSSFKYLGLPIF
eukprot:PITA_03178